MRRLPVESSDIVSVGYDVATKVLEIEFRGGRIYQYRDVPTDMHEQLLRAESHGQYFNTFIHGHFRFDRIQSGQLTEPTQVLAFVTGNARKFRDFQQACEPFGLQVEQLVLPVDEIQSLDAEEVALKKAKQAYRLAGRPVVVQDTFWNIVALRGFPGAYMNDVQRWFTADNFLKLLEGKTDRSVVITDTIVYYDGKRSKAFTANILGMCIQEARGQGSAIDTIVVVNGQTHTIAEVEDQQGRSSVDPAQTVLHELAKWLHVQRRLKRA